MKLFTLKIAQVGFFCCLLCESKLMLTPALLNYGSPICSHSVQSFWHHCQETKIGASVKDYQ